MARADRARVIVDAADYFAAVRTAMLAARSRIMLIGWDFDTRIALGPGKRGGPPSRLGDFILWLAESRPDLEIMILKWDVGTLKMLARGSTIVTAARWAMHERIHFKLDGAHPVGASHHQKIVVIDDSLAVCGGIDMTSDRWDTCEHRDDDPRRKRPGGKRYGPWHDVTMLVDGEAARALGALSRDRWQAAGGDPLPPVSRGADVWPDAVAPMFRDVEVGIARTRGAHGEIEEVREVEALYVDLIGAAQRFIYAENQYFASRRIADAIARRMAEPDPPEIVLVNAAHADGWLEQQAMDTARARLVAAIAEVDHHNRFRVYHPVTREENPIYVHAKLTIVDDRVLRIGSANMNNRSLGLDSECDLVIEAANDPDGDTIRRLRLALLAEHLGSTPAAVEAAQGEASSLIRAVEALRSKGRSLVPHAPEALTDVQTFIADNEVLDPEAAGALFEPFAKRQLFRRRQWLRKPRDGSRAPPA